MRQRRSRDSHLMALNRWSPMLAVVAAGVAVCALAWMSISLTWGGRAAAIWPANAVILACLLRAPMSRWPAFLISGLLGNMLGDMLSGDGC